MPPHAILKTGEFLDFFWQGTGCFFADHEIYAASLLFLSGHISWTGRPIASAMAFWIREDFAWP